ncbi:MAG: LLM class flavin-dependent oxidoreductase [Myxococcales bacterium]|nr:LLM class flavin-dependent oxidoreductase [Myxococcales bacterium]
MSLRLGAFLLPSAGATPAQYEEGFAGQNPNFYQAGLRDASRVLKQVEELGFDFAAFSEHHFHVEGLELSNNPVLLGSWAAMQTRRLRIAQMGNVLPARNPLLLAEDLAMLDHFSEGRMIAGFARGYQQRHVLTIGQKMNAYATQPTDPEFEEHDRINRELFNEHYAIIRRAWSEPLFRHEGQHWRLPPPGIVWDHPATQTMAPGMVDTDGELQKVGIAPLTLQEPEHIESFIPFTTSPETLAWAARERVTPVIFTPIVENASASIDGFHQAATEAGRKLDWGKGIGHFREIVVADTDEEAHAIMERGLGYIWTRWHDWFGLNEALRRPGEEGVIRNHPATIRERGYSVCGTIDGVAKKLETLLEGLKTDLLVLWIATGPAPIEGLLKSNDLLVNKVLPKLGIELEQIQPKLRKEYTGPGWRD